MKVFFFLAGFLPLWVFGIPALALADDLVAAQEEVRALIKARQNSVLASQIDGRIVDVALKEGESFRAGDVLIRFDCRLYASERDQARLEVDSAARVVKAKKTLSRLDSGSRLELELAENDLAIAKAALRGKAAIVDYCVVVAPFNGSVVELFVENHEYRRIGEQLLTIQEDQTLVSELLVPARLVPRLHVGQTFPVRVDDLDKPVFIRVERLGGAVDAVSQTVKLYGVVIERPQRLLPGMIGTASFGAVPVEQNFRQDLEAYPIEALAEADTGSQNATGAR